jgi:Ca2+:H+ antiporter
VLKIALASFALAPVAVALKLLDAAPVVLFPAGAVALIPLAWLVGESTDQAAKHVGPELGALLNATFGNATELFIAFFAIASAEFEVVRGSLTGSVVSNLLLVLGLTLVVGKPQRLDRVSVFLSLGLVGAAAAAFVVPAEAHWDGIARTHAVATRIFPACALLFALYAAAMVVQVRRDRERQGEEEEGEWSLRASLGLLATGTAATGVLAELVTSSIEDFSKSVHLSVFFVAVVFVALVGNAAEHGAAILVAARGEVTLAVEVALRSSAQVAAGLIPALALLSWLLKPLPLAFRPVEIAVVGGGVALTALLLAAGRSDRVRGAVLVAAYAAAVVAFYVFG